MLKNLLISLSTMIASVTTVQSQNARTIDSLRSVAEIATIDQKYKVLQALVSEYIDRDNQKALEWVLVAEQAAYSSGDKLSIVKSQRLKAQVLWRLGKTKEIILLLETFIDRPDLKEFHEEQMAMLNLLAASHLVMGYFDNALDYFFRTNELAVVNVNKEYQAISTKNIGITYYKLKDYRKALPYMLKAFAREKSMGELPWSSAVNISLCYSQLKDFENANVYLNEGIQMCGKDCNLQGLTHIKYALGCIYFGQQQYDKAREEFSASLRYADRVSDFRMQLDNIYLLAKINVSLNQPLKAESYLKHGEEIIKKGTSYNIEMIKVYEEMSSLYLRLKKFPEASYYQSKYIEKKDSIYNERLITNLMKIEANFQERAHKAKIAQQDEQIFLNEEIIRRQSTLNIITGLFSLTFLLLLTVVFRSYRTKKNVNALLERKIKERTAELDARVAELYRITKEKELQMNRLSRSIRETIVSLEGIELAATMEGGEEYTLHLNRIREAIRLLSQTPKLA